jgi:hypothetical protein
MMQSSSLCCACLHVHRLRLHPLTRLCVLASIMHLDSCTRTSALRPPRQGTSRRAAHLCGPRPSSMDALLAARGDSGPEASASPRLRPLMLGALLWPCLPSPSELPPLARDRRVARAYSSCTGRQGELGGWMTRCIHGICH